ncbi:MAG: tetratricopeptide repeat protein [Candidatus Eisenbacteria bacterium]|nr:tetratricopeptide repeat protein [Candidatus Eisenbacteria bacterium]
MSPRTPAPGDLVGRFRVVEPLDGGGQAVVWRAEDTIIRRPAVLKLLAERLLGSAEARRRLLREIEATRLLDHPGIPTTFGSGEWQGQVYVAQQLVDGETASALAARARLPVAEAVRIAVAAAEALGHAHSRGVVHRDVSGGNIMIDRDGRVFVIDFGFALIEGRSRFTAADRVLMTPAFVSPEVAAGDEADPRSDLYGLGVVFYELLTGALPFRSRHAEALIYAAANEAPARPSERRADLPEWIDRAVLKALAKRPADRYQEADAFIADLRAAGGGDAARPASPLELFTPGRRTVAVAPFRDLSGEGGGSDALARGLTEAVTASLAAVPEIAVVAPEPDAEPGETWARRAETLGARFVVEGTLRRIGPHVRITYGVTDLATRVTIGGDTLDGMAAELFALEDRLTEKLLAVLDARPAGAPRRRATRDPASHERYLQALGYLQRFDDEASVDGAIRLLETLTADEGDSALAAAALARAYLDKYGLVVQAVWEMKAADACARALALDPDAPEVLVTLGDVHNSVGRHEEAIATFGRAIAVRHDLPDAWLGLALAHERLGRFDGAEAAARQAIALRPSAWAGYDRLGVVCFRQARYALAVEPWRAVTQLSPENARGHAHLGAAYFSLDRLEDALEAYRRSIAIRPNAIAWAGVGTVEYYLGHHAESAQAFERAVALKPLDSRMWGHLGSACQQTQGGAPRAREAFERAVALGLERVRINPNFAEEWVWLGCWFAEIGDPVRAREAVSRALSLGGQDVSILAQAGIAYETLGERRTALRWIGEAMRRGLGRERLLRDPSLAELRKDDRFRKLIAARAAIHVEDPGTSHESGG